MQELLPFEEENCPGWHALHAVEPFEAEKDPA
jgi:hypothetical protein